jgi:hypothetical protein
MGFGEQCSLLGPQALFDRFRVLAQVKHGHDDHTRGLHGVENTVRVVGHQQLSVYSSVRTTDSRVAAQQASAPIQFAQEAVPSSFSETFPPLIGGLNVGLGAG